MVHFGSQKHRKYKIFAKTAIECLTRGIYLSNYVVARKKTFFAKKKFFFNSAGWSRFKDPLHNAPQSPHHICVYYYGLMMLNIVILNKKVNLMLEGTLNALKMYPGSASYNKLDTRCHVSHRSL